MKFFMSLSSSSHFVWHLSLIPPPKSPIWHTSLISFKRPISQHLLPSSSNQSSNNTHVSLIQTTYMASLTHFSFKSFIWHAPHNSSLSNNPADILHVSLLQTTYLTTFTHFFFSQWCIWHHEHLSFSNIPPNNPLTFLVPWRLPDIFHSSILQTPPIWQILSICLQLSHTLITHLLSVLHCSPFAF